VHPTFSNASDDPPLFEGASENPHAS
jgi:hypothetical protein